MRTMRLATVVGIVSVALFGAISGAAALDYPPTTVQSASVSHAASTASTPDGLPFTGANTMTLVWIALGLIALGVYLVTRKRRHALG
jgi:LPXTG-motif cell wall-anchored protein